MLLTLLLLQNIISNFELDNIEVVNIENLKEGDHIFRFGAFFENSILTHHGIYTGNNNVIHFSGGDGLNNNVVADIQNAKIQIVTLDMFLMNKYTCWRIINNKHNRSKIISRAYSQLYTNFGGYSPANNNCEHFANWCRTGYKKSRQTQIISNFSNYLIKLSKIDKQKIKNLILFSNDIKKIIKPFEYFFEDIILIKSGLEIFTDVLLN